MFADHVTLMFANSKSATHRPHWGIQYCNHFEESRHDIQKLWSYLPPGTVINGSFLQHKKFIKAPLTLQHFYTVMFLTCLKFANSSLKISSHRPYWAIQYCNRLEESRHNVQKLWSYLLPGIAINKKFIKSPSETSTFLYPFVFNLQIHKVDV